MMKNASLLKSNKIDSPKTPGGISKSLLTPCRRVGLSRNWKKQGPSPFVSPLPGSIINKDVIEDEIQPKKRKTPLKDENETPNLTPDVQNKRECNTAADVDSTPTRNIDAPRCKKSKILLNAINNSIATDDFTQATVEETSKQNTVVTPVRTKSLDKIKKVITKKLNETISANTDINFKDTTDVDIVINNKLSETVPEVTNINIEDNAAIDNEKVNFDVTKNVPKKSPNNLTKECVVVIQNKIFKNITKGNKSEDNVIHKSIDNVINSTSSQCLFDSDNDEVPLANLDKKEDITTIQNNIIFKSDLDEDDNFIDTKMKHNKNKTKLNSVKNKSKKKVMSKTEKPKSKPVNDELKKPSSQSSFDDDDDFEFENKRTILIRKNYDKVAKPSKAKSTGSITQRDIDELKARIEYKKKLLLANAMTEDTKDLRELIKKWQRGCQDALMELMDLMKSKLPDKQSYSEILQNLKIPSKLVGYDSENDCFVTPEDAGIILSQVNDM